MKTTNNLINKVSQMTQSKWILPTLMAVALITAFLGVTGCSPPSHMRTAKETSANMAFATKAK